MVRDGARRNNPHTKPLWSEPCPVSGVGEGVSGSEWESEKRSEGMKKRGKGKIEERCRRLEKRVADLERVMLRMMGIRVGEDGTEHLADCATAKDSGCSCGAVPGPRAQTKKKQAPKSSRSPKP